MMSTSQLPSAGSRRRSEREFVSPHPGGPFSIAVSDFREALALAPLWLHSGWVDVIWRYRRTRLGPLWHTLGLGAFVLVMGVLWSRILNQDPVGYFRFVGTGLVVWSMVASFVTDGTSTFIGGQSSALAMRYPYPAFALAHVWRSLLLFCHHFLLVIILWIFTWQGPGPEILLIVPGLALLLLNGVWISTLVGMACLRRRDLVPAISTGMQIILFATPVFWPRDLLGSELAFAAELNPLYHLLQIVREPLLGNVPGLTHWLWGVGTCLVGWVATAWLYGRCRDRFAYWY